MPHIGGTTCTFVRGAMPAMRERSQKWQVPGINGYGIAVTGKGDSEFELTAVFFSNEAGVNLWANTLYAKQGMIVTVVNDHSDSNSRCFLDKVGTVQKTAAVQPGTGVTIRGEIKIEATVV